MCDWKKVQNSVNIWENDELSTGQSRALIKMISLLFKSCHGTKEGASQQLIRDLLFHRTQ